MKQTAMTVITVMTAGEGRHHCMRRTPSPPSFQNGFQRPKERPQSLLPLLVSDRVRLWPCRPAWDVRCRRP